VTANRFVTTNRFVTAKLRDCKPYFSDLIYGERGVRGQHENWISKSVRGNHKFADCWVPVLILVKFRARKDLPGCLKQRTRSIFPAPNGIYSDNSWVAIRRSFESSKKIREVKYDCFSRVWRLDRSFEAFRRFESGMVLPGLWLLGIGVVNIPKGSGKPPEAQKWGYSRNRILPECGLNFAG